MKKERKNGEIDYNKKTILLKFCFFLLSIFNTELGKVLAEQNYFYRNFVLENNGEIIRNCDRAKRNRIFGYKACKVYRVNFYKTLIV